jgi:hypothetical protein
MTVFASASATATASVGATATATASGNTLDEAIASANVAANEAAISAANSLIYNGEDYANFYSIQTIPKQVNNKEWVPLDGIDTTDFTIDKTDSTKLICNNAGIWNILIQYQLVYTQDVTIQEGNNCLLSGWVNINGADVDYSGGTGYVNRVGSKNVLTLNLNRYLEAGDVIRFGVISQSLDGQTYVKCESYIDESGVSAPSVIFSAIKCLNYFQNYSLLPTPSTINVNQYVPFSFSESFNWSYDPNDNTIIECKNAGNWTFIAQYQMVNVVGASRGDYAQVAGWFNINGVDVPNSDAAAYIALANGKYNFIIGYAQYFNLGDKVKIGIRSSNSSSDNILHTLCDSFIDSVEVVNPSVVVSAVKTSNVSNLFTTVTCPKTVNNNEYIPITNIDNTDSWNIDNSDNTKIICVKPGKWQFVIQYQLVNLIPQSNGKDTIISGWININGTDVEYSDATGYSARPGALHILTVGYVSNFVEGDVIRIGVRSSSTNGTLNAVCGGFVDTTGIYAPSVIITASEI